MASLIKDNCTNCAICAPICPTHSIYPGLNRFVIDSDTCTDCGHCVSVCPVEAIRANKPKPKEQKK